MRKTLDSINALNLKFSKGELYRLYFPIKNKIVSYNYDTKSKKLEKLIEYDFNEEILNFHINKEDLIIIGKNNKAITRYDNSGNKVFER
jgi:hypothetical protein